MCYLKMGTQSRKRHLLRGYEGVWKRKWGKHSLISYGYMILSRIKKHFKKMVVSFPLHSKVVASTV